MGQDVNARIEWYTLGMRRSKWGFTLIEVMIVMTIISVLAAILVPNFKRARARGQLGACLSQCKNLATALEMYSVENDGRFPALSGLPGLNVLINTNFIKRLPTCPTAGVCTFSDYQSNTTPDQFSFSCVGNNHGENFPGQAALNIPSYSNGGGAIDHP